MTRICGSKLLVTIEALNLPKVDVLPPRQRTVEETALIVQSRQMLVRPEVGVLWITAVQAAGVRWPDTWAPGRTGRKSVEAQTRNLEAGATWSMLCKS